MNESYISNNLESIDCCDIRQKYLTNDDYTNGTVTLIKTPFKCIKFSQILNDYHIINKLKHDILPLIILSKLNDLYSLKQSEDLSNCNRESVKKLIQFLKVTVRPRLEEIFGICLDNKISITASMYQKGDVLLCHDDKCEDRCIAFVYYLTDGSATTGGSFDMFNHNSENGQPLEVVKSIPPEFNSFVCFEVGNFSYHQVAEVVDERFKRLSINGWFHSSKALEITPLQYKDPLSPLCDQVLLEGLVLLNDFIDQHYCTPSFIEDVRDTFEGESHILIEDFFVKTLFENCKSVLNSNNIKWLLTGPANRRKYEYAFQDSLVEPLDTLINLFKSSLFVSYLRSISGLSFKLLKDCEVASKMVVELQKWKTGFYTMATDNDMFFKKDGLDVFVFFNSQSLSDPTAHGGYISYLSTDDDTDDNELLTVEPIDNAFCAVYRTSDTVRFVKYVNSYFSGEFYCLAATYYE